MNKAGTPRALHDIASYQHVVVRGMLPASVYDARLPLLLFGVSAWPTVRAWDEFGGV